MSGKKTPFTPAGLLANLRQLPAPGTYWVAYSGGADSTALLRALHELGDEVGVRLKALHVNHGLHPDSDGWQHHCEEFCRSRGIHLRCTDISVNRKAGTGLEAEARRQRYAVAKALLNEGDFLLTAHHSDDQSETVLLNLMRGSGVDGLAGMPRTRQLGKGWLVRPLLSFSGQSLRTYLAGLDIDWIEDVSNADEAYDRNFLRHSLMPVLERRWTRASDKIALSAVYCREASELLSDVADTWLSACLVHPQVLKTNSLSDAGPARLKLVLRRWLHLRGAPPMPARRLEELCRQCGQASPEHHVKVSWDGWLVQLYRHRLWLQPAESLTECPNAEWSTPGTLDLGPVTGQLSIEPVEAGLPANLKVSPRRGGEKIHLSPENLHRSVKNLLQEASVPPWLRASIPLLQLNGETVALGDWIIASSLQTWLSERGAALTWKPAEPLLKLVRSECLAVAVDPS